VESLIDKGAGAGGELPHQGFAVETSFQKGL